MSFVRVKCNVDQTLVARKTRDAYRDRDREKERQRQRHRDTHRKANKLEGHSRRRTIGRRRHLREKSIHAKMSHDYRRYIRR